MEYIDGLKTYIVAALMIIAGVLYATGLLTLEVLIAVMSVLNGAGFAAVKSAVNKI